MILFDGGFGLILLALWLFCIIDVITTDEYAVRNLPKLWWLVIVLLLPDIGSIAWLVAGRRQTGATRPGGLPYKGNTGRPADVPRPASAANPDDDAEFLRQVQRRAEEQRRRAREAGDPGSAT